MFAKLFFFKHYYYEKKCSAFCSDWVVLLLSGRGTFFVAEHAQPF